MVYGIEDEICWFNQAKSVCVTYMLIDNYNNITGHHYQIHMQWYYNFH
jgi:hypothetical protein